MQSLLGSRREWGLDLLVATASGLFLGLVGPFGSYLNGSHLVTVAYWLVAVWAGMILFGVTLAAGDPARVALEAATGRHARGDDAAGGDAVRPALPRGGRDPVAGADRPHRPAGLVRADPGDLGSAGHGLRVREERRRGADRRIATRGGFPRTGIRTAPGPAASRLGREVIALQMEDHYVRVHTAEGSGLVLIPLRQAVHELGAVGQGGLKVHRSWWVAREAVAGFGRDGRNLRLRLINGLEVPVARTSVAEVKAGGWLDQRSFP